MTNPTVALLGTGTMGAGMARCLLRAGIPVRAWNRDPAKAQPLAEDGAQVCPDAAEAVRGADVVLTMLFDADSAIDVVRQAAPVAGTIWLQTTTVGIDGAARTVTAAEELGLVLVDCPVLGTRKPAEDGALVMLASGPREDVAATLEPVLDAVGSRTLWLGEAGRGSRLKMVCNAFVLSVTAGLGQSVALARGLGLDPADFLSAIDGGAVDSPYAHVKGPQMIAGDFPVSFSLTGARKDAGLIVSALGQAGVDDRLGTAMLDILSSAVDRLADPSRVDMGAMVGGF